jgi:hypothetical protein
MKHLIREDILKIPITFVNEEFTTFQATMFLEYYEALQNHETRGKKISDRKKVNSLL